MTEAEQNALSKAAFKAFRKSSLGYIPRDKWPKAVSELDPARVYNHLHNLAIVLKETDQFEEGIYIRTMMSSYVPRKEHGFEVFERLTDAQATGPAGELMYYRLRKLPEYNFPDRTARELERPHRGAWHVPVRRYTELREEIDRELEQIARKKQARFPSLFDKWQTAFTEIATDNPEHGISLYAKRWIILLDWLRGDEDGRTTADKLNRLANGLKSEPQKQFTNAYSMTVLLRSGHIDAAKEHFLALDPTQTPQYGWFTFLLIRYTAGHVETTAPDALSNTTQKARTPDEWWELERPLRDAQKGYLDLMADELLPRIARTVEHLANQDDPGQLECLNLAGAARQILQQFNVFNIGATTDPLKNRAEARLAPRTLAVWQQVDELSEQEDFRADIKNFCKRYEVNKGELETYWQKVLDAAVTEN